MSSDIAQSIIKELREENELLKREVAIYLTLCKVTVDCLAEIEEVSKKAKDKLGEFAKKEAYEK